MFVSSYSSGGVMELHPDGRTREIVPRGLSGPYGVTVDLHGRVHAGDHYRIASPRGRPTPATELLHFVHGIIADGDLLHLTSQYGQVKTYNRRSRAVRTRASGLDQPLGLMYGGGALLVAEAGGGTCGRDRPRRHRRCARRRARPPGRRGAGRQGRCTSATTDRGAVYRIATGCRPFLPTDRPPQGIAVTGGRLFAAETGQHRVVAVDLATGERRTTAEIPAGGSRSTGSSRLVRPRPARGAGPVRRPRRGGRRLALPRRRRHRPALHPRGDPMSATVAPDRRQILQALSGLLLALFVSTLSSTVVSTALPRMHPRPARCRRPSTRGSSPRRCSPRPPRRRSGASSPTCSARRPSSRSRSWFRRRLPRRGPQPERRAAHRLPRAAGHRRRRPAGPRPDRDRRDDPAPRTRPLQRLPEQRHRACPRSAARCSAGSSSTPRGWAGAGASSSASRSRSLALVLLQLTLKPAGRPPGQRAASTTRAPP